MGMERMADTQKTPIPGTKGSLKATARRCTFHAEKRHASAAQHANQTCLVQMGPDKKRIWSRRHSHDMSTGEERFGLCLAERRVWPVIISDRRETPATRRC